MTADKAISMPFLIECSDDIVKDPFLALCADVFRGGCTLVTVLAEMVSLDYEVVSHRSLTLMADKALLVELETVNIEIAARNRLSALITTVIRQFCHFLLLL